MAGFKGLVGHQNAAAKLEGLRDGNGGTGGGGQRVRVPSPLPLITLKLTPSPLPPSPPSPNTSASTSFFNRSSIASMRAASMPAYSIMFFRGRT